MAGYATELYRKYRKEGRCISCGEQALRKRVLKDPDELPWYQYCAKHYNRRKLRAMRNSARLDKLLELNPHLTKEQLEDELQAPLAPTSESVVEQDTGGLEEYLERFAREQGTSALPKDESASDNEFHSLRDILSKADKDKA